MVMTKKSRIWYTKVVPDGETEVGFEEFSEVRGIYNALLPASVRRIDDYAFEHCWNLEEVRMQEGVEYIGDSAFYHCAYLERIKLPGTLRVLGEHAFEGCLRLPELKIPEGVLALGEGIFDGCGDLKKLAIPGSVRMIHENAFGYGEKELEIIYTGTKEQWEELSWVGKETWLPMVRFAENAQVKNEAGTETFGEGDRRRNTTFPVLDGVLSVPAGVAEILRGAYLGNQEIRKVILPDSLKKIGDLAFAYCPNLSEVTIPASVEKIEYHVFKGCEKLREIVYEGNEEQFDTLDWMEKRGYLRNEPDEDFKEFSHWIKFIG